MPRSMDPVQQTLSRLQAVARGPEPETNVGAIGTRRLPSELARPDAPYFAYGEREQNAVDTAAEILLGDLRFEHVAKVSDELWTFLMYAWAKRGVDHVQGFMDRHAHEPMDLICYVPVEQLTVTEEIALPAARLLPVTDPGVPRSQEWFRLDKPVGAVAAVAVTGTNYSLMADRARATAAHALRLLRIALSQQRRFADDQLRFTLAISHAFNNQRAGWRRTGDDAYELTLQQSLVREMSEQPSWGLPEHPVSDIDKKALIAVSWMDRATMTGDRLVALLYLFFALEALLGDRASSLKANVVAFRQAMLSHIVQGHFTHPDTTWLLYDKVRSAAVHGEQVPDVSSDTLRRFAGAVRETLHDYSSLARERGLVRRSGLIRVLSEHPDRPELVAWIRANGGPEWESFLRTLETVAAP